MKIGLKITTLCFESAGAEIIVNGTYFVDSLGSPPVRYVSVPKYWDYIEYGPRVGPTGFTGRHA